MWNASNTGMELKLGSSYADVKFADIAGTLTTASQTNITGVGTISTGTWQATDVGVAHGGTGASSASDARTNLGVAIGSDVQAYDAQLADVAGLAVTDGGFIVGNISNFQTLSKYLRKIFLDITSKMVSYPDKYPRYATAL